MTMSGLNDSQYVEQMIEQARPTARDMANATAREAIRAAERRDRGRRRWPQLPSEVRISMKKLVIAALVVLTLIFTP